MKGVTIFITTALLFTSSTLFADKTSVTVSAPAEAKKGSEITIILKVVHKGNNIFHYTNFVYLKINGKELKRWNFKAFGKPESAVFTRKFTVKAIEDMTIEAMGNCNLHGSKGIARHEIKVQ